MQLLPVHKRSNNLGLERGASCYLERACLLKATELENHLRAMSAGLFHLKISLSWECRETWGLSCPEAIPYDAGYGSRCGQVLPKGIPFLTTVTFVLS